MNASNLLRKVAQPGALALAALLAGCVAPNVTYIKVGERVCSPISTEQVKVVQGVPHSAYYVANITAKAEGTDQRAADADVVALKQKSAELGANRLVLRHWQISPAGNCYWMTAHAFRVED